MAKASSWQRFQRLHFYLLAFLLLQFLVGLISGYRLHQTIIFYLTLALYASGVALFFRNLFPFRWKVLYFVWYTLPVLCPFLMFALGGILVAIIVSLTLYPVYPKGIKYEQPKVRLYEKFQGFMSRCCHYEVVDPKAVIFEKYLGTIQILDGRSLKNARFVLSGRDSLAYYPAAKDTIIFLKLE